MPLNKVRGNMYDWVTHTWNTVKGKCPHGCHYCYMTKWGEQPSLHFDPKELKINLGGNNFIFVGSSCDLFANAIPEKWIIDTLEHCREFDNSYLFQSKNPERIYTMRYHLPEDSILGTTIESNRIFKQMGNAPTPIDRVSGMLKLYYYRSYKTMITIEPIMDFDLDIFINMMVDCKPSWINIGANTNYKVKLKEPSPDKVMTLIDRLNGIVKVKIKPNLKRLMEG